MDIDVVILWVDGTDPAWLAEKARYLPPQNGDSDSVNRYRDWNLLRYLFRGIENYLPWVRKVHLVTWGHVPDFLNPDCPKLHLVRHSDFIPSEYLPTFNSHAIEMNLHRIPGLAEHFIYFNDDMFVLRPMDQTRFFRDGLPCVCGREVPWIFRGSVGTWAHAAANDLGVINRHFSKKEAIQHHGGKFYSREYRWKDNLRTLMLNTLFPDHFSGFLNCHAPAPYRKQTFEAVWNAEPELLDRTCLMRFRGPEQVNQWVCLWWQAASGEFEPCQVDNVTESVTPDALERICRCIARQEHDMICVNDPEEDVDVETLAQALEQAFSRILPEKCSFER